MGDYCEVYVLMYNRTSGKFYQDHTIMMMGTFSQYSSLSPDKYFMTFSGSTRSRVYSDFEGSSLTIEHTFGATVYNKFSKNMKYLVTTEWGKSRVYEFDCNWNVTGGYMLN